MSVSEKFKIGDRVRAVTHSSSLGCYARFQYDNFYFKIGETGTIREIQPGWPYLYITWDTRQGGGYLWDCFEKVVEDTFERDGIE